MFCFGDELWDRDGLVALVNQACDLRDQGGDAMSVDDLREQRSALKALLRQPFWLRRAHCTERWSESLSRRVAMLIGDGLVAGGAYPLLRVSSRRFETWLTGQLRPAREIDACRDKLVGSLTSTICYCQWLAGGGDPDVGRYLALWMEQLQGG